LGPGTGGTTVAAGAVLDFGVVNYATPESVTLDGGAIEAFAGPRSFGGSITLGAAGSSIFTIGPATFTMNGPINAQGFDLTVETEDTQGFPGTFIFNSGISGTNTATLTFQGPGSLTLNGAGTYGGGTTVTSGTLFVGNDSAVGTGTLTLDDGTTILAASGDHAIGNAVTLGGAVTIGAGPNTLTFNGVVSGSTGSLVLDGNLTLTGQNIY